MIAGKNIIKAVTAIFAATMLMMSSAGCGVRKNIEAGATWEVTETTNLSELTIAEGAIVKAPEGYSLTMTVDGVETGQELVDLDAADGATYILPGTYKGDVILTIAEANPTSSFKLRQALYLDEAGVVEAKSVLAAVDGKKPVAFDIKDIKISSTGECFNGIYVTGGEYTLDNIKINFTGDGRSDFEGYGAAIMATGKDTRLVVNNSKIKNKGIVRTGVIAGDGSKVIVKNSIIETQDGEKPPHVLGQRGGSGLGGSIGLCRATVLLGTNTEASYINSTVTGTGWGLLASDMCYDFKIAAVNSKVAHTGDIGGYGAYCIDGNGNAIEYFLGTQMDVSTTSVTLKGGNLFYGDSTSEAVSQLNKELDWRLTDKELESIPVKNTVVNSKLFGIMCTAGNSTMNVSGGTIFNTGDTTFMNKGQSLVINVDGSGGVQLNPGNGVIMQLMDDDDPGMNNSTYKESTTAPERDEGFDIASTSDAAISTFSNISLKGDFYNSFGWGKNTAKSTATSGPGAGEAGMPVDGSGGPGGSGGGMQEGGMPGGAPGGGMPGEAAGGMPGGTSDGSRGGMPGGDMPEGGMMGGGMPEGGMMGGGMPEGGMMAGGGMPEGGMMGGGMPGGAVSGRNMALTFNNARITGIISSSESHHTKPELEMLEDYKLFGVVTNTAHEPINNGVILSLTNGSTWTVTGTSYLTSLIIESGSTITASEGYKVTMTVDGIEKNIGPGEYKGLIMIKVTKI